MSDVQFAEVKLNVNGQSMSSCETMVTSTPSHRSPVNNSGVYGFFQSLSCCVSSRKMHHMPNAPEERLVGTGARSRARKHKSKHSHMNLRGTPITGNIDLISPVPISSASSGSIKSSPILENWMSNFTDWRLVDIPVIPGTHHSGVNNPR